MSAYTYVYVFVFVCVCVYIYIYMIPARPSPRPPRPPPNGWCGVVRVLSWGCLTGSAWAAVWCSSGYACACKLGSSSSSSSSSSSCSFLGSTVTGIGPVRNAILATVAFQDHFGVVVGKCPLSQGSDVCSHEILVTVDGFGATMSQGFGMCGPGRAEKGGGGGGYH